MWIFDFLVKLSSFQAFKQAERQVKTFLIDTLEFAAVGGSEFFTEIIMKN